MRSKRGGPACGSKCGGINGTQAAHEMLMTADTDLAEAAILDAETRLRRSRRMTKMEALRQLRIAQGHRDDLPRQYRQGSADVGATPEVRMKRRYDTITRLGGRLNPHQQGAAEQIREVYEAIEISLTPARLDNHGDIVDCSRVPKDPIDRMPARLARAWERVYIPWTWQVRRPVGDHITVGGLVIAVCIDNAGLRWCERRWRLAHGRAFEVLSGGLTEYAVLAGWERG